MQGELVTVSVIIPTYNRAHILRRTLRAYLEQTGDHRILEILVVDDGSIDNTQAVISSCQNEQIHVRSLYQTNQGLAAARNHAVREAKGDLILFGDDDIIPAPEMTAEHVAWHDRDADGNLGVLGFVPWLPEVKPTPFMKWSGLYGPQFNFGFFKSGLPLGFQFGYFCNTSVRTKFLLENGFFSEAFRTYGYEDLELSFRLMKKGYKLLYNPRAIGYHNKFETFANTLHRVNKLYQSWPEFATTEAGEHFLKLWSQSVERRKSSNASLAKQLLRSLKGAVVPLLRPLLDTHLPLPSWLYEQVFYHYVTPFGSIVGVRSEAQKAKQTVSALEKGSV